MMNADNRQSVHTAKELPVSLSEGKTPTHFAALSRFEIANGMTAEVKQAFRDRPRHFEHVCS